jgi:hypothetical protein
MINTHISPISDILFLFAVMSRDEDFIALAEKGVYLTEFNAILNRVDDMSQFL